MGDAARVRKQFVNEFGAIIRPSLGPATTVSHRPPLANSTPWPPLFAPSLAGSIHMTNAVANTDAKKNKVDVNQVIADLRAELDKMKGDLQDEIDKMLTDAEKSRWRARREALPKAVND